MGYEQLYITALAARRAVYGFGLLAHEMFGTKEANRIIRQLEEIATSSIRTIQTIHMLMSIISGAGFWDMLGPLGWILAAGTAAGAVAYGAKALGGG